VQINAVLTGPDDLDRMNQLIVSYLRVAAVGLAAFVVCACARIGASGANALADPKLGDPPVERDNSGSVSAAETETARVDALELALARLDNQISNLKLALALMGPLPEAPEFVTISPPAMPGDHPAPARYEAAAQVEAATVLFFEAELARIPERNVSNLRELTGANPRYRAGDSVVRLTAGALTSDATADLLCVELSALAGPCRGFAPVRAYR
jgi:hypothetical protein